MQKIQIFKSTKYSKIQEFLKIPEIEHTPDRDGPKLSNFRISNYLIIFYFCWHRFLIFGQKGSICLCIIFSDLSNLRITVHCFFSKTTISNSACCGEAQINPCTTYRTGANRFPTKKSGLCFECLAGELWCPNIFFGKVLIYTLMVFLTRSKNIL